MSTCFFLFFFYKSLFIYIYTVYKGDKKKIMIKWRFELNAWSIAYIG